MAPYNSKSVKIMVPMYTDVECAENIAERLDRSLIPSPLGIDQSISIHLDKR